MLQCEPLSEYYLWNYAVLRARPIFRAEVETLPIFWQFSSSSYSVKCLKKGRQPGGGGGGGGDDDDGVIYRDNDSRNIDRG